LLVQCVFACCPHVSVYRQNNGTADTPPFWTNEKRDTNIQGYITCELFRIPSTYTNMYHTYIYSYKSGHQIYMHAHVNIFNERYILIQFDNIQTGFLKENLSYITMHTMYPVDTGWSWSFISILCRG
jgi:hypothetical protein